jgi:hypothetical protein
MEQLNRITDFTLEVERWFIHITSHFRQLNKDAGLTPEDRKRLKEFYLETCVTPRIRESIRKHFPEEFPDQPENSSQAQPAPSRILTHPDRPRGRFHFHRNGIAGRLCIIGAYPPCQ